MTDPAHEKPWCLAKSSLARCTATQDATFAVFSRETDMHFADFQEQPIVYMIGFNRFKQALIQFEEECGRVVSTPERNAVVWCGELLAHPVLPGCTAGRTTRWHPAR